MTLEQLVEKAIDAIRRVHESSANSLKVLESLKELKKHVDFLVSAAEEDIRHKQRGY